MTAPSSPIRSQAQHAMLKRAAGDADYAERRGIGQAAAQTMLDAHDKAGAPDLVERVEADTVGTRKPKTARKFKLLGS